MKMYQRLSFSRSSTSTIRTREILRWSWWTQFGDSLSWTEGRFGSWSGFIGTLGLISLRLHAPRLFELETRIKK
jgi:hypothetical protein